MIAHPGNNSQQWQQHDKGKANPIQGKSILSIAVVCEERAADDSDDCIVESQPVLEQKEDIEAGADVSEVASRTLDLGLNIQ